MKEKSNHWLFIAGMVGPVFYFFILSLIGVLWSGYDPISQHMSELGGIESPYKNLMNVAGFMGLGVMIMLFGVGFYLEFVNNLFMKLASFCVLIAGLFMIIVGFFPCDAKCIDVTISGKLHTLTSIPQSILLPLAVIMAGFGFEEEKEWGSKWKLVSMILGWGSMAVGPLMSVSAIHPIIGLAQRIGVGLSLTWIAVVSVRVHFKKS